MSVKKFAIRVLILVTTFSTSLAAAIANSGRELVRINPRDDSGSCYKSLTAAVEAVGPIDAVDLIITPKVGPKFIEEMAHLGIENVFMQVLSVYIP